jgi:hypothetical protein
MTNPFETLELEPLATVSEITARVRELAEDADEPRQKLLRALWEELTLHPRARITAAVATFVPEGGEPAALPPPRVATAAGAEPPASLLDKLPLAGLIPALAPPPGDRPSLVVSVHDDPLLQEDSR